VIPPIALDHLRSRGTRREEPSSFAPSDDPLDRLDRLDRRDRLDRLDLFPSGPGEGPEAGPEQESLLAESVGVAMLVVLDTLEPPERVAFVLHDMFGVSFDEIATILERSPAASRQLASRARRRLQGADLPGGPAARQREIVEAFLAASRRGDFEALIALLDPQVALKVDETALSMASSRRDHGAPVLAAHSRGARTVAEAFAGRAGAARLALVDGLAGATWAPGGRPRVVFRFVTDGERITEIEMVADEESIAGLEIALLPGGRR
jgi:ketosteroid isomerase-like protein